MAMSDSIHRVAGIAKAHAMRLEKRGFNTLVSFKPYMHSERWTAMTAGGCFQGQPEHLMFKTGIPDLHQMPPYCLRSADGEAIAKIQQRYDAVHGRVRAAFLFGECSAMMTTLNVELYVGVSFASPWNKCFVPAILFCFE